MMTYQKEIIAAVNTIIFQTLQNAKKIDALDDPYFCAHEIADLIDWCAPINYKKAVARKVLENCNWPMKTSGYVRNLFDLPY